MQALCDALQQAARPLSTVQVAAGFQRVRPEKLEPLLATLSLVRQTRRLRELTWRSIPNELPRNGIALFATRRYPAYMPTGPP